jgi:hypothetical protein
MDRLPSTRSLLNEAKLFLSEAKNELIGQEKYAYKEIEAMLKKLEPSYKKLGEELIKKGIVEKFEFEISKTSSFGRRIHFTTRFKDQLQYKNSIIQTLPKKEQNMFIYIVPMAPQANVELDWEAPGNAKEWELNRIQWEVSQFKQLHATTKGKIVKNKKALKDALDGIYKISKQNIEEVVDIVKTLPTP